jgi:hypothetical protein
MGEKRPTNSELNLDRLEKEDALREEERGILELFDDPPEAPDEDAPMLRDCDAPRRGDPSE